MLAVHEEYGVFVFDASNSFIALAFKNFGINCSTIALESRSLSVISCVFSGVYTPLEKECCAVEFSVPNLAIECEYMNAETPLIIEATSRSLCLLSRFYVLAACSFFFSSFSLKSGHHRFGLFLYYSFYFFLFSS